MMCCCRDAAASGQADGLQARRGQGQGQGSAADIEEPHQHHHHSSSSRVVRLASFDEDLITPVEVDQLTNNRRSKIRHGINVRY